MKAILIIQLFFVFGCCTAQSYKYSLAQLDSLYKMSYQNIGKHLERDGWYAKQQQYSDSYWWLYNQFDQDGDSNAVAELVCYFDSTDIDKTTLSLWYGGTSSTIYSGLEAEAVKTRKYYKSIFRPLGKKLSYTYYDLEGSSYFLTFVIDRDQPGGIPVYITCLTEHGSYEPEKRRRKRNK